MALNAEDDKPAQRRWIQLLQAPSQKTASCPSRSAVASMIASRQMVQLWVASAVDWLLAEESWWEPEVPLMAFHIGLLGASWRGCLFFLGGIK